MRSLFIKKLVNRSEKLRATLYNSKIKNKKMSKDKVTESSTIKIEVGLNNEKLPVKLEWQAAANPDKQAKESKAMLISFFDKETLDTFKIDLWTTEMKVNEMDKFFYQTLRGLADTYFKATQNQQLATDMQRFVQYFGEQTEIIPPVKQ